MFWTQTLHNISTIHNIHIIYAYTNLYSLRIESKMLHDKPKTYRYLKLIKNGRIYEAIHLSAKCNRRICVCAVCTFAYTTLHIYYLHTTCWFSTLCSLLIQHSNNNPMSHYGESMKRSKKIDLNKKRKWKIEWTSECVLWQNSEPSTNN